MFIRYAFLADTVTLDAIGKMSAIGIFDVIGAVNFPTVHRDMNLVVNLEGTIAERGEHTLSVELRDKAGNNLNPRPVEQKIAMGNPSVTHGNLRAGLIVKLQDVLFPKPGQYEFVVFGDNRFLGRVSFEVQQVRVKMAGET